MQNTKKHQVFKFYSGVIKMILIGLIASAFLPFFASRKDDQARQNHFKAESLAYQILQLYIEHIKNTYPLGNPGGSPGRGLASVAGSIDASGPLDWTHWRSEGEMGLDPWGDAYEFKLEIGPIGDLKAIAVWSKNDPEICVLKSDLAWLRSK